MQSKNDRAEQKVKQIEAQKDKSSQGHVKVESSSLECMPKDPLELNRCGSNHTFYKKRTYLTKSNKSDLDTKRKRTIYCHHRFKTLYRKTRRSVLAKCERIEEKQLVLRKQRFANRNKRTSLTKHFWTDKRKSENKHKHTDIALHLYTKHGTVRSEIWSTVHEDQILPPTNILPNLCRDIGFEQVS